MKKLLIIILAVAALGFVIGLGTSYVGHNRTCAVDNVQYQSVMKGYNHTTNITDLSKALTQLSKDQCAVEGK